MVTPKPGTTGYRLLRLAGLTLAAAAPFLLPGPALAGCGNYVTITHPAAGARHLVGSGHGLPTTASPHGPPLRGRLPCRGPQCSSHPDSPPLLPPPPPPAGEDDLGTLATPAAVDPPSTSAPLPDRPCTLPVHRPFRIEHPPRLP